MIWTNGPPQNCFSRRCRKTYVFLKLTPNKVYFPMEAPGIETEQFLERKDEGGQWAPLSLHQVIHNNIYQNRQFNSEVGLALNAWGGFLLGIGLTTSVLMFVFVPYLRHFMGYLFFLSVFHILEYAMTALFRPAELRWSSFIINHSKAYNYALLASFLEYWIEYLLLPSMKMQMLSIFTGFVLMAGGKDREEGFSGSWSIAHLFFRVY